MAQVPALVRSDGVTPLTRQILGTEIASASMMTARSVLTGHPAEGLDPARLVAILRGAEDGNAVDYLELAEAMEEKDLHYVSVLGTRKRQVSQLPITVEAASDAPIDQDKAQLLRNWLKRDTVEAEIFDLLDAIGKGFAVVEIIWDVRSRGALLPDRLVWRDPRWFQFDRIDGTTPLLRGTGTGTPLPANKFIYHVHSAKSGIPIRGGLARPVAWAYLFKNLTMKDWVSFAEVFGFPIRVGKYGPGATEDQIRTLMRAVAGVATDAAAVIPDSMTMEFIKSESSGSADLYQRLCEYLDKQISKAVLGQTATTDSEGGGLGGSGKEHNDVRGDIERSDAKQLAATLNRDLVRPIIDFNFGPPPSGERGLYPQINIGRPDPVDTKALMEGVKTFVDLGGQVAASVIADRLGLPDPQAGEALLTPTASAVASAPGTSAPTSPLGAPGGPFPPETAATRFLRLLTPSYGPIAGQTDVAFSVAAADGLSVEPARDDIDAIVQLLADDGWEAALAPMLDPALAALATAGSYEAAIAALPAALATMDASELALRLERAAFAVRLAAELTGTPTDA